MTAIARSTDRTFQTDVPARLDRLPWSRWHWMVVAALGITWIIDGLEVTMIGAVSAVLQEPESLHFTGTQIGLLGTAYLAGAVLGALVFGYLTDRLGRKKLFTVTLGLYLVAAFLTAFSWDFCELRRLPLPHRRGDRRRILGDQLGHRRADPRRVRGWADLAINGTFWVGAAVGSLASIVLLDPVLFPVDLGWRLGFGLGAALGLVIIFLRHHVPESPRWLLTHGHPEEAERVDRRRSSGRSRATRVGDRSRRPRARSPSGRAAGSASASSPGSCSGPTRAAPCSAWP